MVTNSFGQNVNDWCNIGNLQFNDDDNNSKRDLLTLAAQEMSKRFA